MNKNSPDLGVKVAEFRKDERVTGEREIFENTNLQLSTRLLFGTLSATYLDEYTFFLVGIGQKEQICDLMNYS